jgi:hypothetical protein
VGLERGPLSLVSTSEELLDRKVVAPVYKTDNTAVEIRHADHVAPSIRKKLAITSPTSGGRSAGIVRSRTQATEFSLVLFLYQPRDFQTLKKNCFIEIVWVWFSKAVYM